MRCSQRWRTRSSLDGHFIGLKTLQHAAITAKTAGWQSTFREAALLRLSHCSSQMTPPIGESLPSVGMKEVGSLRRPEGIDGQRCVTTCPQKSAAHVWHTWPLLRVGFYGRIRKGETDGGSVPVTAKPDLIAVSSFRSPFNSFQSQVASIPNHDISPGGTAVPLLFRIYFPTPGVSLCKTTHPRFITFQIHTSAGGIMSVVRNKSMPPDKCYKPREQYLVLHRVSGKKRQKGK